MCMFRVREVPPALLGIPVTSVSAFSVLGFPFESPRLVYVVLEIEPGLSCMLGKLY